MPKRILYLGLDPTHYPENGVITHWPIIKIVPRDICDPMIQKILCLFDHYTHVLITSKSTVEILSNYLLQLGISLNTWRKKITLAVGEVTADHLNAIGITPAAIASEETAEGLIAGFKKMTMDDAGRFLKGMHVFWPHSSQSRPILRVFLAENCIRHTTCDLYDPRINIPGNLPDLESFEEIVFTSPSTVDAFLEIFGAFPMHAKLIPIGPVTGDYLNKMQAKKYEVK